MFTQSVADRLRLLRAKQLGHFFIPRLALARRVLHGYRQRIIVYDRLKKLFFFAQAFFDHAVLHVDRFKHAIVRQKRNDGALPARPRNNFALDFGRAVLFEQFLNIGHSESVLGNRMTAQFLGFKTPQPLHGRIGK